LGVLRIIVDAGHLPMLGRFLARDTRNFHWSK
jgi:hypothetical protein